MMKRFLIVAMIFSLFMVPASGFAANKVADILKKKCTSCHQLTKPEYTSPPIDYLQKEYQAPPLYYAGVKFNKAWLVEWLQDPTRIRPAGAFYRKHVKSTDKGDVIDKSTLEPHLALPKSEAVTVADALMALKGPERLVKEGVFKGKKANPRMGAMYFVKLRGCASCHQYKPGKYTPEKGGLSGPELYTGGDRLQADFIYSFIKNPQKFNAYSWMPKFDLSERDLQLLTGYITQLSAAEEK